MSVILFELRDEHIQLLKHLRWSVKDNLIVNVSDEEDSAVFGENNIYEAIDLILNGKPEGFDPFNTEDIKEYTDEEKVKYDTLYGELPTALDIILFNGNFEVGLYKTQYHNRNWKKTK